MLWPWIWMRPGLCRSRSSALTPPLFPIITLASSVASEWILVGGISYLASVCSIVLTMVSALPSGTDTQFRKWTTGWLFCRHLTYQSTRSCMCIYVKCLQNNHTHVSCLKVKPGFPSASLISSYIKGMSTSVRFRSIRPKNIIRVFMVTCWKKLGSVSRK